MSVRTTDSDGKGTDVPRENFDARERSACCGAGIVWRGDDLHAWPQCADCELLTGVVRVEQSPMVSVERLMTEGVNAAALALSLSGRDDLEAASIAVNAAVESVR